jgi:hypothetical protein
VSKDVRVVCDFCRNKYYERERLCVLINAEHLSKGSRICVNCLPELGITGCTDVSGHGFEYDRLGTDEPPEPSWREQIGALSGEWPRDPCEHPSELDAARHQHGSVRTDPLGSALSLRVAI